jgi:serine protease Do
MQERLMASLSRVVRNRMRFHVSFALAASCVLTCFADAVKDREGAVRGDKATMENDARWIYNDIQRGFDEAGRQGKPLLVVLRCVPCLACAGIDASVLNEKSLQPLLDQFVCVRVINANSLDLRLFQIDYDLSFSTVFFNADRTIYGRYGSWSHQKNPLEKTAAGFAAALQAALALHRDYPANKPMLAGKQGEELPYKRVLEVPGLAGKYKLELDWKGRVVPSCVHCHQIGEGMRNAYWQKGEPVPGNLIYPQPAPETVGLTLAQDAAARVSAVAAGSAAEKAGVRAGDELLTINGQPLISSADVSWALHRAPDRGGMPLALKRDGSTRNVNLQLEEGWRARSDIARRVGTWQMRGMVTGGLQLEDLPDVERQSRGLAADRMALLVKHVGEYGQHAAAKKAGFKKGDVIVSVAKHSQRVTEGQIIGTLLQKHQRGQNVAAEVMREGQKLTLSWPLQ